MPWPVLDTFSDANGTLLAGSGVAINGTFETDRLSDSGSKLYVMAGNITSYGQIEVQAGRAYCKTAGAGVAPLVYLDNPGTLQTDQVSAVLSCFTNAGTVYVALRIHRYFEVRYYFQASAVGGTWNAGTWYLVNSLGGLVVGSTSESTLQAGTTSFSDPGRFTFGSAGTPVDHTVSYKLSGTQPSTTGFTVELIVNGVTIGWAPRFTTTYPAGNMYPVGWSLSGVVTGTPGSQTGVHLNSFTYGAGATAATAAEITGPAVVGVGIATSADYSPAEKGLVGQADAGVMRLTLTPYGSVLGSNATFALSDGSGGTFSGTNVASNVLTIPSGTTAASFVYTPSTAGSKTITATGGGAASAFTAATMPVVGTNKILILDGDSLTDYRSGNTSSVIAGNNQLRWSVFLQRRLGTTAAVYNYAASGQGVGDQIADFATEIQPKIQAAITAGATVYFVQYGAGNSVNQVSVANSGFTTTQVGNNIAGLVSSICTSAKNLNARVIVLTYPRRKNAAGNSAGFAQWQGGLNEANFNAALDTCNAAIRSGWQLYANAIIDWANTAENLAPEYTTGRLEDGTHPYLTNAAVSHDRASVNNEVAALVFGAYRALELGGGSASGGGGSFVFGN